MTLQLVVNTNVKDGHWTNIEEIHSKMAEYVNGNEPGTLHYQSYRNEETGKVWFCDTYATPEAFLAHFNSPTVQEYLPQLMEYCTIESLTVFGEPTPEVRAVLDNFGSIYGTPWTGFSRIGTPVLTA